LPVPADIRRARVRAGIFARGQASGRAKPGDAGMLSGGQTPYPHIPDPLPSLVGTHHPPTYENGFFTPPELSKTGQINP
jgi:hypothetical protein